MPAPIEDYALLSDCRTAALVSREGDIDWLCAPRFDSPSLFGALLGDERHGCWSLRPVDPGATATRSYRDDTFELVTRWQTATGVAEVHDVMPIDHRHRDVVRRIDLVRRVVGLAGTVEFVQRLTIRFDYARALPWVRQVGTPQEPALVAMAGPDALVLRGAALRASGHAHHGTVTVGQGAQRDLTLTWFPSHHAAPGPLEVDEALERTHDWWQEWADRIDHRGEHHPLVVRSLLVLRALTHLDTGGIVAAATTSLPEQWGGTRNWDYRYVWLRDASLTLQALLAHGFVAAARHWRAWLLRAVAGDPADVQIVYGLAGERELAERELRSLPGYLGSAPVRVGNGAVGQYQADVIGEVLVALAAARAAGLAESAASWPLERALLEHAEQQLDRPDDGIWEIRGDPQLFTHSRVMMWAGFDRAIRTARTLGLPGPVARWESVRDRLRVEIDERGYDAARGHFVQHYGSAEVDASLLVLAQVGYCGYDDPRMLRTVAELERTLLHAGLLLRYRTQSGVDGLAGTEHPFLACSFWLVEQYARSGRAADARALMDRLCGLANDVGMLSEEYDVEDRRHAGNTPQAFSHLALVRAADALAGRPATRAAHP